MNITTKESHPSVFVNKTFTVQPQKFNVSSVDVSYQIILVKNRNTGEWIFEEVELIDLTDIKIEGRESVLNLEEQKEFISTMNKLFNFEDEICSMVDIEINKLTPSDYINEVFPTETPKSTSSIGVEEIQKFIQRLKSVHSDVEELEVDSDNVEFQIYGREICILDKIYIDGQDEVENELEILIGDMENMVSNVY